MNFLRGEFLNKHTTLRIGGPADFFCQPRSTAEFKEALAFAQQQKLKVLVMGNGSNILFADSGWRGLIIKLALETEELQIDGEQVVAAAGVKLSGLLRRVAQAGLSGLEYLAGVPGTIGGAVVMNLGAYGEELSRLVLGVRCLDIEGQEKELSNSDLKFGYRQSLLQQSKLYALEVKLKLKKVSSEVVQAAIREKIGSRCAKHPLDFPSAGSVFRNPQPRSAGQLIEAAGLKGLREGGAQISTKHANFIVNLGQAKAEDVIKLIRIIQTKVKKHSGILLEPELKIMVD